MQTQEQFFQQHAVNGELSADLMAQMLTLPQGDTPAVEPTDGSSASPDAAGTTAATAEPPKEGEPPAAVASPAAAPEPQPVILAKDGIHTIPYDKLEEARREKQAAEERERLAREEAQRLAAEVEALKKAPAPAVVATPSPAPAPVVAPTEVDFGDYSDESMKKAVAQIAEAAAARAAAPLLQELQQLKGQLGEAQKQAEVDATKAHFTAIYTAHPDLDSIVESAEFQKWKDAQPAFARPGIEATLEGGTAPEVIELFSTYKAAAGKTTPPPPPPAATAATAAAVAEKVIAAAKAPVPTSLSEIPAGTSAHHDEAAAMLEMSPEAAMAKFEGKSPEQIQVLLNKVL